jgi:hypothetical protein
MFQYCSASTLMLKHRSHALTFLALVPLLCIGGLFGVVFTRPPVFDNHEEVVIYMLGQQNKRVKAIDAALPWPEGVNYYAYGPAVYPYNLNVSIDLVDGQHVDGKIECRRDKYDCDLTITALNFDRVVMPDIRAQSTRRWPGWVYRLAHQIGVRM